MLTRAKRWVGVHHEAMKRSIHGLYTNPLMTCMTILVISLTMMLPLTFWLLGHNVQRTLFDGQKIGPLDLFIEQPLPEDALQTLIHQVQKTPGVGEVRLISPTQGLEDLQEHLGLADLSLDLTENPLPPVVHVIPSSDVTSTTALQQLHDQLQRMPHVESIQADLQWMTQLDSFLRLIMGIIHGVMLVLSLVVVVIIGNMLHLAFEARREERQVLTLIGASRAYILRPHVYVGMWYGVFSAVVACCCVDVFFLSLRWMLASWNLNLVLNPLFSLLSWQQIAMVLLCSLILGWFGSKLLVHGHEHAVL